ncbi:hypothetical protein D6D17_06542 [Aureobasidium pullulans]|uniref:DUF1996 domain-containing protein n=1 Tax=Aureobasidium pullulans TaxID=5580 RepID=A0A4S9V3J8_AURPU|nr:hypothetical protein D6D22_00576 [Aureobasidium pullulans]THW99379.1 hypothetical protein D6D17_06542 [Aureobasidium pullulans]THX23463.1 hypothetical protein D6D12_08379 [Aureobasidium pullulans]THX50656.1 hypothetical protein D6D11_05285 [Aureobasidium pullulans]THY16615.1 hypothetical protein D6D02_03520 [Aureobasidium pullulans]
MKTANIALFALTAGSASAQFFVLYGRDTVVSRIDPIVSPGGIGMHAHEFMGAGNVDQNTDYDSLQKSTCSSMGRANGNPIIEDKSVYWHPTLYVKANNGTYLRVPTNGHQIYYINAGTGQMREPFEFPKGFRMTAGNAYIRAAQEHTPTNKDDITQWICHETPSWNEGAQGGFPKGVTSCSQYPYFNGAIEFPHCWNGKDFNLNSPYSHVAYPVGDIRNGACPDTHPIKLPHIFMENNYDLSSLQGEFEVDSFVLSNGDPTGFGFHADFYNGWQEGVLPNLLTGSSACDSHDIGDCSGVTFDSSMNWAQCTTTNNFSEDLDGPLSALPGCNPITTVNPAPQCKACAAGVVGGQCNVAGSSMTTSTRKATSSTLKTSTKPATSTMQTTTTTTTRTVTSTTTQQSTTTVTGSAPTSTECDD